MFVFYSQDYVQLLGKQAPKHHTIKGIMGAVSVTLVYVDLVGEGTDSILIRKAFQASCSRKIPVGAAAGTWLAPRFLLKCFGPRVEELP